MQKQRQPFETKEHIIVHFLSLYFGHRPTHTHTCSACVFILCTFFINVFGIILIVFAGWKLLAQLFNKLSVLTSDHDSCFHSDTNICELTCYHGLNSFAACLLSN